MDDRQIEHGHDAYTTEELLEQAQGNAASLLLATLAVITERGISVDEWATGVAEVFMRSWTRDEAWTAAEVLDALLTNLRSLGATVVEVDLTSARPSASIRDYPDEAVAVALGVDPSYGDAMLVVGVQLARRLGFALAWQREGEQLTLRIEPSA